MAFDPNLPANNSPLSSAEMRNQFLGLKQFINTQSAQILTLQNQVAGLQTQINDLNANKATPADIENAIQNETAGNCANINPLEIGISNPPTQGEVEAIY